MANKNPKNNLPKGIAGPGRPKGSKTKNSLVPIRQQLADAGFKFHEELRKIMDDPKATPELRFAILQYIEKYHPAAKDYDDFEDDDDSNLLELAK
jgi:hypothetical protein